MGGLEIIAEAAVKAGLELRTSPEGDQGLLIEIIDPKDEVYPVLSSTSVYPWPRTQGFDVYEAAAVDMLAAYFHWVKTEK